jgi:hypothetical protein
MYGIKSRVMTLIIIPVPGYPRVADFEPAPFSDSATSIVRLPKYQLIPIATIYSDVANRTLVEDDNPGSSRAMTVNRPVTSEPHRA